MEPVATDYLLVSRADLQELGNQLKVLAHLYDRLLSNSGTVNLPATSEATATASNGSAASGLILSDQDRIGTKYLIRPGGLSYADVVDREVKLNNFSLDEAWATIKPLITAPARRAKESMRRALDNDKRFIRVEELGDRYIRRETIPGVDDAPEENELGF